jgi:hypothetical protein
MDHFVAAAVCLIATLAAILASFIPALRVLFIYFSGR